MKKNSFGVTKKRCGIYYLTDGLDVIYVGCSRDVAKRVGEHARYIDFSQVFVDDCEVWEFRTKEAAGIREFDPILNVANTYGVGKGAKRLVVERERE